LPSVVFKIIGHVRIQIREMPIVWINFGYASDKGYHSNQSLVDLEAEAFAATSPNPRSRPAELEEASCRSRRRVSESAAHSRCARPTAAGLRGERLERPFAHLFETGGMRRVRLRGPANIRKRLLIHTGGFNLGLLMRHLIGVGTPRSLQGRLVAALSALLTVIRAIWLPVTRHCSSRQLSSTRARVSLAPFDHVQIRASNMALTTGC
jgi:transposase